MSDNKAAIAAQEKGPPPTYAEATQIRPLKFYPTDGSLSYKVATTDTVSTDECIAHLKLISVFADLRDTISSRDGIFDLWDCTASQSDDDSRKRGLALLREKRWAVYVTRAVDRFESWFKGNVLEKTVDAGAEGVTVKLIENSKMSMIDKQVVQPWTPESLPPVDVLMVWHVYMLNPRDFLEDSIKFQCLWFWSAGFPWKAINECINETLDYVVAEKAIGRFEAQCGRKWVNEADQDFKILKCPCCDSILKIPWTTTKGPGDLTHPFQDGRGFADTDLTYHCDYCSYVITRDVLRLAKFRKDVIRLYKEDIAMPGSLLPPDGIPKPTPSSPEHTYVNHLIKRGISTDNMLIASDYLSSPSKTLDDVRKLLEEISADRGILAYVGKYRRTSQKVARIRRMSVRRVMSRYWDNSSLFSLDLVGAVLRQGTFVRKMDEIDWLHSPALEKTMERLIMKYRVFLEIIAQNEGKMAVPTLDVDLAWHTHQLSPYRYYAFCKKHTGTLINHDDKVEEGKLSDGFEWTSKQYQKLTGGQLYSTCTCWYCEAVRESNISPISAKLFSSSSSASARSNAISLHSESEKHQDSDKMAHISAHNAIAPKGLAAGTSGEQVREARLKHLYEKANRRLRKRGISTKPSGKGNGERGPYDGYFMAWGILPLYMPFSAPYIADCDINNCDGMYPSNPACADFSPGAMGNCVSGMCGGRVGAGGCGSGACSGGTAGGQSGNCSSMGGCGASGGCGGFGGCGGMGGACGGIGGGCGGGGGGCGGGC